MSERRTLKGKKLLVASFGLGAASVIGCNGCSEPEPVGNLVAPPEQDMSDPGGGAGSGGEDETDPASDDSDGGP